MYQTWNYMFHPCYQLQGKLLWQKNLWCTIKIRLFNEINLSGLLRSSHKLCTLIISLFDLNRLPKGIGNMLFVTSDFQMIFSKYDSKLKTFYNNSIICRRWKYDSGVFWTIDMLFDRKISRSLETSRFVLIELSALHSGWHLGIMYCEATRQNHMVILESYMMESVYRTSPVIGLGQKVGDFVPASVWP